MTVIYIVLGVIAIFVISSTAITLFIKSDNYKPSNGEIHNEKITVALSDFVFESHNSKTEIGTVGDYIHCSFDEAGLTVSLPYEAVAKSGRFLVSVTENKLTRYLWVEPAEIKKEYFLKTEKLDRFEDIESNSN